MSSEHCCKLCNYISNKASNYNKHIKTKKHLATFSATKVAFCQNGRQSSEMTKVAGSFETYKRTISCDHCQKITSTKNWARHNKRCKERHIIDKERDTQALIERLKLEKAAAEKKAEDAIKSKEEIDKDYRDFVKVVINRTSGTTINNSNNNSIVNNSQLNVFYVVKNYQDAHNYEDLMAPKLTKAELKHVREYGPSAGCERLIINRCLEGIAKDKRPIHCVDASREKFMLKTKGEWEFDVDKDRILKPAFDHMRSQFDISDKNTDIEDRVRKQKMLLDMDNIGGKKTIKYLVKKTLLKNKN